MSTVPLPFIGMNTVIDPASIKIEEGECVSIANMDTLAPSGVRSRFGYMEVLNTPTHSVCCCPVTPS